MGGMITKRWRVMRPIVQSPHPALSPKGRGNDARFARHASNYALGRAVSVGVVVGCVAVSLFGVGCKKKSASGPEAARAALLDARAPLTTTWADVHSGVALLRAGKYFLAAEAFAVAHRRAVNALTQSHEILLGDDDYRPNERLGGCMEAEAQELIDASALLQGYTWLAAGEFARADIVWRAAVPNVRGMDNPMAYFMEVMAAYAHMQAVGQTEDATGHFTAMLKHWDDLSSMDSVHYLENALVPYLDDANDEGLAQSALRDFVKTVDAVLPQRAAARRQKFE